MQLQGNGILGIETGAWTGFGSLTVVRVFGNSITFLQSGAFTGLTSLETLYINNNGMQRIESGAFDPFLSTLSALFAHANSELTIIDDGTVNGFTV